LFSKIANQKENFLTMGNIAVTETSDDSVYLRPETVVEPLVCGWYAWTHLISTPQHAMNVTYRHLPLLSSFVENPSVHAAAAMDPSLFGGPFVDLPVSCVPDIRRLIEETKARCAELIAFAQALRSLDFQLQDTARGFCFDDFYAQVPLTLNGLVEFVYDLNSHPKVRIHEELVYEVDFESKSQEIMLSIPKDAERRFFMSTPRLSGPTNVFLRIPFKDFRIDALFSARTCAAPFHDLCDALGVEEARRPLFRSFFTGGPIPRNLPAYKGTGVRLRYFGHACVLIQSESTSVLIDPNVAWGNDRADSRFTFSDLPDHIDYVVLSHNHQDHCVPEVLLQLRHRIGRVIVPRNNSGSLVDPSMKLLLRQLGIEAVDVMDTFESIDIPGGSITSLPFPGEHADLDVYARQGIHICIDGYRMAFLVDSDGRDPHLFRRIAHKMGRHVDALFIGMECHGAPLTWLYKPLLTKSITRRNDESRRLSGMNCERAWNVLQEFDVSRVFVYAMGQEPWLRFIMGLEYTAESIQMHEVESLIGRCRSAGISVENLYLSREIEFPNISADRPHDL
jgi:L-ascorbate metabolism protein UlaG (beta-lactamase superfamily)